ncbi:uncharacterized protein LOC124150150 [Haliotis rufescens]|uniref:uncharacterized protein LOC124150150 n=1 Tax=Haliotis rufescens TaxID=6454 RepID=UPI001EB098B8|nr:uncharacterized protein LOC124150150 [Haliotis rufescens]
MQRVWSCFPYSWVVYCLLNYSHIGATTAAGVYARLGGPVTVTWAMSPIKEFKVMKEYRIVFQITGSNKVTLADEELRTRINSDSLSYTRGTFSFQLYNVTPSDAGQYSCHLDPTRPPYRRTRMPNCGQTLYVIDFHHPYIHLEREHNRTVNLTCNCRLRIYPDSVPTVSVTWRENNIRLYSGERNHMASSETWSSVYDGRQINHTSTLTIRDSWRENDRYKCQAGVGEIQSEWSVDIALIYWSDDNKNYTVVPGGEDAMMTWKMPSLESGSYITSPSGPHFMWKLSDKWNVGHTYTSRLQIKGVSPSSEFVIARLLLHNVTAADAGKYFCVSGYRRVPQCGHKLIVSRKPEEAIITATKINLNQDRTLICSTTSRSLPRDHNLTMSYIWRRDNARLLSGGRHQVSGSTLTIPDVREEDSGSYSCQGREEGGQVSGWSSIFVLIVRQPRNSTFIGTHTTTAAISFIIGCSVEVITLFAIAVVVLLRRKSIREYCDRRFRDLYITPTDNTNLSLHQMTDPEYDVIDTYLPQQDSAEGHRPHVSSSSACQGVSFGALSMDQMPLQNMTYPGYDIIGEMVMPHLGAAEGQKTEVTSSLGCQEDSFVTHKVEHQATMEPDQGHLDYTEPETTSDSGSKVHRRHEKNEVDENVSVRQHSMTVQEPETVHDGVTVIMLNHLEKYYPDESKDEIGISFQRPSEDLESVNSHVGAQPDTGLKIMSDLDNVITKTMSIHTRREGRCRNAEKDVIRENAEAHQELVEKVLSEIDSTKNSADMEQNSLYEDVITADETEPSCDDGYEGFMAQGQYHDYEAL